MQSATKLVAECPYQGKGDVVEVSANGEQVLVKFHKMLVNNNGEKTWKDVEHFAWRHVSYLDIESS